MWTQHRLVAFDTETTGLRPFDGDRIMEFAAVELRVGGDGRVAKVERHQFFIQPGIPIPREVTLKTGITDAHVADAPGFDEKADEVRQLLEGAIVVAHNLPFDMAFLRAELGRLSMHWPRTVAEIDTLVVSQLRLSHLKAHKLEDVAREMAVPLDQAHRAVNDAEACGRCFVEMTRRLAAPDDLAGLLDWSDGVGPPPATGHLEVGERGVPEFLVGPHAGRTVEEAPDHLQWMTLALERTGDAWRPRFPEELRTWAKRWLRVRAAGRAPSGEKSPGPTEWGLDPRAWRPLEAP